MVVCRNTTGALQIEITLTKLVLLNLCKVYTNTSKIYKNNNKTVPSSVSQGVNVIPVFFSILFSLEVQEQICIAFDLDKVNTICILFYMQLMLMIIKK